MKHHEHDAADVSGNTAHDHPKNLHRKYVLFVIALIVFIAGCGSSEPVVDHLPNVTQAVVTRVVDGDTIDVRWVAGPELPSNRIRLIGVDTPEIHGRSDPFGPEASEFTKKFLDGNTVWLTKDVSETDRYQRALRYVWLRPPTIDTPTYSEARDHMFNALLLSEGYAKAVTYPPDVSYSDLFIQLQQEARAAGKGLWGTVSQTEAELSDNSKSESRTGRFTPGEDGSCVMNGIEYIKGNRTSYIYHLPGGAYYANTKAEDCFYDAESAEAAGYRPSKR